MSLITELKIHTDNFDALDNITEIIMGKDNFKTTFTHYYKNQSETAFFILQYSGEFYDNDDKVCKPLKLAYTIKKPSQLKEVIMGILNDMQYPKDKPSTDGDLTKGYELEYRFRTLKVKPAWIVYSK